jgi:hypothetical protein
MKQKTYTVYASHFNSKFKGNKHIFVDILENHKTGDSIDIVVDVETSNLDSFMKRRINELMPKTFNSIEELKAHYNIKRISEVKGFKKYNVVGSFKKGYKLIIEN